MPKRPDLTLPLAQPITFTRGQRLHLVTLMDVALLIRDLELFRQARPVWDRVAEMILLAAETRKQADVQEATRQMLVALERENWWKPTDRVGRDLKYGGVDPWSDFNRDLERYEHRLRELKYEPLQAARTDFRPSRPKGALAPASTPMVRMSTIIIAVILSAATAKAQNYPPFLHEAQQALVNEFRKLEHQDWQEWRQQQEWRLRQADDEDDATCWRLQDHYQYSDCRAKLLAIRQECAQGGDFFDSECD